jgi:hypothetical protein
MGGFLLEFGVKEHRFDPSGETHFWERGKKNHRSRAEFV